MCRLGAAQAGAWKRVSTVHRLQEIPSAAAGELKEASATSLAPPSKVIILAVLPAFGQPGPMPDAVRFRLCAVDRGGVSEPLAVAFAAPTALHGFAHCQHRCQHRSAGSSKAPVEDSDLEAPLCAAPRGRCAVEALPTSARESWGRGHRRPRIQRILSDDRWTLSLQIELFQNQPPPTPTCYLGLRTGTEDTEDDSECEEEEAKELLELRRAQLLPPLRPEPEPEPPCGESQSRAAERTSGWTPCPGATATAWSPWSRRAAPCSPACCPSIAWTWSERCCPRSGSSRRPWS
eukprot:s6959_g2.t1